MAYHNLDKSSAGYPIPSAPVRYHVEPETAQPVYAQPVYAQPTGAQPPMAQPVSIPMAQLHVPAAQPAHLPAATPVAPEPGVFVPPPMSPEELEHIILNRRVEFKCGKYFQESRTFFRFNCCKLVTATLLWGMVFMAMTCGINHISPDNQQHYPGSYGWGGKSHDSDYYPEQPTDQNPPEPSSTSIVMTAPTPQSKCKFFLKMALLGLMTLFVGMPAVAGWFHAVFNAMKLNGPIRFRDFFACFRCCYFCRLLRLSFLLKLGCAALSLLFILPGIWFNIVTIFALPLHRQHNFLGACKSISYSIKVVNKYFCSMLGFLILIGLMQFLGFLCFGVGLLYTIPVGFVALCYCYNDLIGVNEMPLILPQPVVV